MREVREYYSHWLPPLLGAAATTLGHNILYADKESDINPQIRRHELIHVEQCERYTTFGFFVLYFYYYLEGRINGLSHWDAYYKNPLEIEAFERAKRQK